MPVAIPAAILGGAALSAGASKSAAKSQTRAADNSTAAQLQMYNQTREDQAPWRQAGGQAVGALSNWYGLGGQSPDYQSILQNLPGYQFQMQQGNEAVQRNLAARGLLQSGAAGKALQQYGQNFAAGYADKYVNGLQSLSGLGQTSTQATGVAGQNAANGISNANAYAGNAQAAGAVGSANAWSNGLQGLVGYAAMQNGGFGGSPWGSMMSGGNVARGMQDNVFKYTPGVGVV